MASPLNNMPSAAEGSTNTTKNSSAAAAGDERLQSIEEIMKALLLSRQSHRPEQPQASESTSNTPSQKGQATEHLPKGAGRPMIPVDVKGVPTSASKKVEEPKRAHGGLQVLVEVQGVPTIHTIPPAGLGTFRLKGEAVQQVIRDAIRIGYRHIDTATIYRNEREIGAVLQETYNDPSNSLTRSDFWITSKLSPYDMKQPRESLLKTLRELQTDYLDLYLIHWPAVARKAASSPEHKRLRLEAWKVLNEAKLEGLLRHVGVSNFTPQHIQELMDETEYGIQGLFIQMEIHPWYWRDALEIQTRFREEGVSMVGYAFLGEGKLMGENCPKLLDEISDRRV